MRRLASGLAVALVLTFWPSPVASPQPLPTCSSLDVLILLDESGSIDRNDPDNRRIEAARQYLDNLQGHQEVDISVALAGFATHFQLYSEGFLRLDANGDRLHRMLDDFTDRHAGYKWDEDPYRWHTDYVEAFRGILGMPWESDCRRTVWFSDGRHDLDGGAPSVALQTRGYDALDRELTSYTNLVEVEGLLIPAVCGEEAFRSQIVPDYFGLADRFAAEQVDAFDIKLFYLEGDQTYGETLELFERLHQGRCGNLSFEHRPVEDIESLTDQWLFEASCSSLPGMPLTFGGGEGVIWNGSLPTGILAETVDSVEILAGGPRAPTLQTNHGAFSGENLSPSLSRLSLQFNRADRFESPMVTGAGVEQACGSVTFVPPELRSDPVTSPAIAGRPLVFSLRVHTHQAGWRPLTTSEQSDVVVFRDGEALEFGWTEEGVLQDPAVPPPGRIEYRFELFYRAPTGPVSTSVSVQVEGLVLAVDAITSPIVAGRPVEFVLAVASDSSAPRLLATSERSDVVVFRDGEALEFGWTAEGNVSDPAAPRPGDHEYRFELRQGDPHGWAVDEVEVVVEPVPFSVELLTSPVFAGRPLEFSVEAESDAADASQDVIAVFLDGAPVEYGWTADGTLEIAGKDSAGNREYRFELRLGHPNGWVTLSVPVESVPLPPGPVMELDRSRLPPLTGRDLTIPVAIDQSTGCVQLDPAVMVESLQGERISGAASFPDGEQVWCSGSEEPKPAEVKVELDQQVIAEEGITISYASVSPQNELQQVTISVPGPIDRERNQLLERLIVLAFLLALFLLLWVTQWAVSRWAGRLPRIRNLRYARFAIGEGGELLSDVGDDHSQARRISAGRIEAGPIKIVRRTPFWRIWKSPYAELSLNNAASGAIVGGLERQENRRHVIHKSELHAPIVLIESRSGPRETGAVMAPTSGSTSVGHQLSNHAREALVRLLRPHDPASE